DRPPGLARDRHERTLEVRVAVARLDERRLVLEHRHHAVETAVVRRQRRQRGVRARRLVVYVTPRAVACATVKMHVGVGIVHRERAGERANGVVAGRNIATAPRESDEATALVAAQRVELLAGL